MTELRTPVPAWFPAKTPSWNDIPVMKPPALQTLIIFESILRAG